MITRLFYDLLDAHEHGETRNASVVMRELCAERGCRYVSGEPQPIADQWMFTVEGDAPLAWPPFIRGDLTHERTEP